MNFVFNLVLQHKYGCSNVQCSQTIYSVKDKFCFQSSFAANEQV